MGIVDPLERLCVTYPAPVQTCKLRLRTSSSFSSTISCTHCTSLQWPAQVKSVRGVHEAMEQTSMQLSKSNVTILHLLPCTIKDSSNMFGLRMA